MKKTEIFAWVLFFTVLFCLGVVQIKPPKPISTETYNKLLTQDKKFIEENLQLKKHIFKIEDSLLSIRLDIEILKLEANK